MLRSSLLGRFNLSNVLAAVGALLGLDYPIRDGIPVMLETEARTLSADERLDK